MAVMTTCCTDSSIIMMVWMYSRGDRDKMTVLMSVGNAKQDYRAFISHTYIDKNTQNVMRTLFLFTVDCAAQ